MSTQAHEPVDLATVLSRAIGELPVESQSRVWQQFAEAAAAFESDDLAPMRRLIKNLYATSRLHANPAYRKSLAEVTDPTEEPEFLDLTVMLDHIRAGRR